MLSSTLSCHASILMKILRKCKKKKTSPKHSYFNDLNLSHYIVVLFCQQDQIHRRGGSGGGGVGRLTIYIKSLISAAIVSHSGRLNCSLVTRRAAVYTLL